MISTRKWLITLGASVVGLLLLAMVVHAEEPYDITNCGSGTNAILYSSKELTIISTDSKGITVSSHDNKAFDNFTFHCSGIVRIAEGKLGYLTYCKFVGPEGDAVVGESTVEGDKEVWKFLIGTGKWKGITGGGTHKSVTRGKPVAAGTSQGCRRATGTYSLPKTQ